MSNSEEWRKVEDIYWRLAYLALTKHYFKGMQLNIERALDAGARAAGDTSKGAPIFPKSDHPPVINLEGIDLPSGDVAQYRRELMEEMDWYNAKIKRPKVLS